MLTFPGNYRHIVLLAIQDEAYRFGRYYKYALRRLNINPRRIRLGYRSSLAAIGYVGRKKTILDQIHESQTETRSQVMQELTFHLVEVSK